MKKVNFKIVIICLIGIFALVSISVFSFYAKKYFVKSNEILHTLSDIQELDNKLNYEILSSSMYLYYDTDLIAFTIRRIHEDIKFLKGLDFFQNHYKKAYEEFLKFESDFNKKEELIFEYLRYSFPLKNSLIYLSNSLKHFSLSNKDTKKVLSILSNIFLAKSSIDMDFLKNIDLDKFKFLMNSNNFYEKAFYKNLEIFLKYFPVYKKYLNKILSFPTEKDLKLVDRSLMDQINKDLKFFDFLSLLLSMFISFLIFSISFAVIKLENYIKELSYVLTHDILTGLYNRYKFNQDVKDKQDIAVAVFNIDKFKNINDYFGNKVGDLVLEHIGIYMKDFFKKYNIKVYRVGADDFAVIFEDWNKNEILELVNKAIEFIESQTIIIDDTPFNVSLSVGVSFERPYLEKADIALKKIKKNILEKVGVYTKEMNKEIEENIKRTKEIKEIIDNNGIVSYFQPIFNKDREIEKYEVLCRVKIGSQIKSIYPYLRLLKEIRLYHKVTEKVLKDSLEILLKYPDINLSVNISIEDLMNENFRFLVEELAKKEVIDRITFEILESEITNYEIVKDFIQKYKRYGASFAIDDFGSGYSNFQRVLSMDIDILKIDGSLIKNIHEDQILKEVVESIVDLAKKANKKTVAEFVHNKEVFEVCKEIGIDYFQGFYLGEPQPSLINVKKS